MSPANDDSADPSPPPGTGLGDPRLVEALEEYVAALEAGRPPGREAFLARHPELARTLAGCLEGLDALRGAGPPPPGAEAPAGAPGVGTLGDYRLLREVGRGGMAVVYEAEQLSLGRRVALKVLPFASTLDPRQLQRFHNEARAAAGLHHPHVVPVYGVGCERGVHFYAMQFIEGQSLAAFLADLRVPPHGQRGGAAGPAPAQGEGPAPEPTMPYTPGAPTAAAAAASTERAPRDAAYSRRVAEWGAQAAEALEHAHSLGVVHRDVKPANLLLDGRGQLWVTDFGLARVQAEQGLTLTGDLVGTLRYMSPEQALAKRVLIDHRTDVYSLGATLYELLTLEPTFGGTDRQELLRQIAFEEPTPPRKLNKAVPAELETVVLKCLEKDPADRYASASELAEDLTRFLEDRPLRARRATPGLRLRKWGRRHRAASAALAAGLLAAVVLAAVLGWRHQRRLARTERGVAAALAQAQTLLEEADKQAGEPRRWRATARLARSAVEKAEGLLAAGVATPELAARVGQVRVAAEQAEADSGLLVELERIRLEQAAVKETHFDNARAAPRYARALAGYGVDPSAPARAAARVRGSRVREELLAALEDWARVTDDEAECRRLEEVLRAAGPGPGAFRSRWRAAMRQRDGAALARLAGEPGVQRLPAVALVHLARDLRCLNDLRTAERVLRAALERFPGDFWLNHELGGVLQDQQPPNTEEAVRFLTAALALRHDSPGVHLNLGNALLNKGDLDGAVCRYRAAARMGPRCAVFHYNLGIALMRKGDAEGAVGAYEDAIRINPQYPEAHCNLGHVLLGQGRFADALAALRRGHRLGSKDPRWPYPSAGWVRQAEQFVALEDRLPGLLRGEAEPADAAEQVVLARCVRYKRRYAAAAGIYARAFAARPALADNLDTQDRYNAACAAALAGCGRGEDSSRLGEKERARLRHQALDWLRADLAFRARQAAGSRPEDRAAAQKALRHWLADPDFAGVRGEALAGLPGAQRQAWRKLWDDVADTLAVARRDPAPQKESGPK